MALTKINPKQFQNPYKFRVYRGAGQNVGTGFTKIAYDSEVFDPNNNFSGGTYTAPISGFYWFNVIWTVTGAGSGSFVQVFLYKNGTADSLISQAISAVSENWGMAGGTLVQLTAGDTIDIWAATGSAAKALDVGNAGLNVFSGFLVSET